RVLVHESGDRLALALSVWINAATTSSRPLWAYADDRLALDPLGRIERRNGIVEGRDGADDRTQSPVPHPLDNLTKLGAIGLDHEVDRQAVGWPCLRRAGDGHECSAGSDQPRGPRCDVAADDVEHQID